MDPFEYTDAAPEVAPERRLEYSHGYIEIDTGRRKRWLGFAAYVAFFLGVAVLLVVVFVKFTSSLGMAMFLVAFMVAYMGIMGWMASRNAEKKE